MLDESNPPIDCRIEIGDFRFVLVSEIRRLLIEARQRAEAQETPDFVSRDAATLIRRESLEEAIAELTKLANAIAAAHPTLVDLTNGVIKHANRAQRAPDAAALIVLQADVTTLFQTPGEPKSDPQVKIEARDAAIILTVPASEEDAWNEATATGDEFTVAVKASDHQQRYFSALSRMIDRARVASRDLSGPEQFARAVGYHALESGFSPPAAFRGIGVYGFRPYQSYLSLADPGDGHNSVTCLNASLLAGVVVHVEHIDRGAIDDREIIEAYRLPAPLNAARVRLQTGIAAPCTAYVGRPLFENGATPDSTGNVLLAARFDDDLLKTAHSSASACSVMFASGVADCKLGMERMTAQQMIRFLTAVAGNVSRDHYRQYLSAAFNINVPIFDDRDPAASAWVSDRYKIAQLAIDLAVSGQVEKVTWDGASNLATSDPIINAFTAPQWLSLIHRAHENGLETYISAGMNNSHMANCVYSGVDGVGIGTSLHYRKLGVMGQLKPKAILDVLKTRDDAAKTPRGVGAGMLATLDRLHFEGILTDTLESLRSRLFEALTGASGLAGDGTLAPLLEEIRADLLWIAMERHKSESYLKHPVIAQAERRLIAQELHGVAPRQIAARVNLDQLTAQFRAALTRGDVAELTEIMR